MVASIFPHGAGAWSAQQAMADFAKSSALLTSSCASAAGWDSTVHDPATAAGPCVLSYVWDSATDWMWVCSVSVDMFDAQADQASRAKPEIVDGIRSALGELIYHAVCGKPRDLGLAPTWELALGQMLAAYAGTTQTWSFADGLREGGHFVTLFYRKPGEPVGMLRPVILPAGRCTRDLLAVEQLRQVIRRVRETDFARHPEWFR